MRPSNVTDTADRSAFGRIVEEECRKDGISSERLARDCQSRLSRSTSGYAMHRLVMTLGHVPRNPTSLTKVTRRAQHA